MLSGLLVYGILKTGLYDKIHKRAEIVNNYEKKVVSLGAEMRSLRAKISELEFQVQTIDSEKRFLTLKLEKMNRANRAVASIKPEETKEEKLIKYSVYKWSPKQLLAIGDNEYKNKDYEKSATFLQVLLNKYSTDEVVTDRVLFQAGVSSFESGKHYDWAITHLSRLVTERPSSKYFRGAKLWLVLANLKAGNKEVFYDTVEEFRQKYRNTDEWEILSGYYEELTKNQN